MLSTNIWTTVEIVPSVYDLDITITILIIFTLIVQYQVKFTAVSVDFGIRL